jgi:hypothetical protein
MNKIAKRHFQDLKFLPLFQMLFLWLNKTPSKWNSPISFQEGFEIDTNLKNWFLNIPNEEIPIILETNWNLLSQDKWSMDTNWEITKYQLKLYSIFFEIMVVRSFCFRLNILSPFGINRQKRRCWEPSHAFSPLVQVNKSEGLYQLRVWRINDKG